MTTLKIGSSDFTVIGAAFGHNKPDPISPLMTPRAVHEAAMRVPLRFGMGRWDCARLAKLDETQQVEAMQAYVSSARTTHWLRHDVTMRTDDTISLTDAAEVELWRRVEEKTDLGHAELTEWVRQTFGKPRHHADLTPWLGQIMPHYSFTLHMGLVPMMVSLRPADDILPEGITLMLNILVEGMYHVDVTNQCTVPLRPVRQTLPLRGLAGSTEDAKRWAINTARLTAKHNPVLSSLLGRLRKL